MDTPATPTSDPPAGGAARRSWGARAWRAPLPRRLRRMSRRPALVRLVWTARDYVRRVWDNSGEDDIFFLAGGIAFNILLAAVPFTLLLVTGVAYAFNLSADRSALRVGLLVDTLLPIGLGAGREVVHTLLAEAIRTRGAVGVYSSIGFVWFSTRLFGSLRSVLAEVFDIEQERGIVAGKLFDIKITVISTVLVVAYLALSAYLALASSRGAAFLVRFGVRDDVMGGVEYWIGRAVAFAVIAAMFFGLYKFLPIRRVRVKTALVAAVFAALLFELAKLVFGAYIRSFNPGSFYTGTIAAAVIVVFWVYYAAVVFILGGEVAQVYDLRRVRRLQRATLED